MSSNTKLPFFKKWNIYQSSRFPILKNMLLVLAFSSSAVSYSAMSGGRISTDISSYIVAFITCLLFFLQLRIADEFKDYEEDCMYRNYRPVPQGIITLKELKDLFIISCSIQLLCAFLLNVKLIPFLLITWLYLFLMSHEFGVKKWLKAHPITYLLSHMIIMPLVDFYATATDWINHNSIPPDSLYWFIALSFFNGINLEIGRKIRSLEDEENGVETYSFLWGIKKASIVWISMIILTGLCAIGASYFLPDKFIFIITAFVIIYTLYGLYECKKMINEPIKGRGKKIENLSGIFTLSIYLLLGLIPYLYMFLIN